MSELFRGEDGERIEVRYLDIPDRPTASNGLPLVDEIVCGPMHLEMLDDNCLYIRVAGLLVNIWAHGGRRAQLSVTVEPDGCVLVQEPASETPALPKRCVTCGDRLMATLPLTCFGCNQRAEGKGERTTANNDLRGRHRCRPRRRAVAGAQGAPQFDGMDGCPGTGEDG